MGNLGPGAKKLATAQLTEPASEPTPTARFEPAVIAVVSAGAASDGNALVTVTWRGGNYTVSSYPSGYTPTVGHNVMLLIQGPQIAIAWRPIGTP